MNLGFINSYLIYIVLGLCGFSLILFILSIIALVKAGNLKKRLNKFLQPSQSHNVEALLLEYLDTVKKIDAKHDNIMSYIENLNSRVHNCVQKVGVVRYNPFDEVGGDLCFALAMLDERNNGVVLNSIYSREGCYTYAKPILDGKSEKYKLASEEEQALKIAINS